MGARGGPAEVSPAMAVSVLTPAPVPAPVMPPGQRHYEGLIDPQGPVVPGEEVLPVLPALRELLPAGGLQRGHVVATAHGGLLFLALAAAASAAGAWCAAVGLPSLGVRAAADAGLDPDRLLLVAEPGGSWPQVVASLLDGCDVVLLCPPARPAAQLRRKLEAAARRFGSVLLVAGEWEGAQARLLIADQEWAGIGAGHGRLRARRARIVAEGRGAGARARSAWLWLPGPDGTVRAAPDHVMAAMSRDTELSWEAGLGKGAGVGRDVLAGTG
jgi:hypothetical protein